MSNKAKHDFLIDEILTIATSRFPSSDSGGYDQWDLLRIAFEVIEKRIHGLDVWKDGDGIADHPEGSHTEEGWNAALNKVNELLK